MDLPGSTALVTGAGSGIGRATALALAARGAVVLSLDIDGDTAAKTAADTGGHAWCADVADRAVVSAVAQEITAAHGTPDVVVNNAGVGMSGRFLDMDAADWDWIVGINLLGAVNVAAAFGPAMVARRSGHLVNVASGLAYTPRATEPGYVTTKAALLALSQCMRADWHHAGVGVSVICPGVVNTPIVLSGTRFKGSRNERDARRRVERVFARGHRPELVADAIVAAVERNRGVVPVGFEARLGWALRGLVPQALAERAARLRLGGL